MIYFFTDLTFKIDNFCLNYMPEYDGFKCVLERDADCYIEVKFVSQISIPNKAPVFLNRQGLCVILDDSVEYRYYSNFFNGEIRELLIDDGQRKTLQVLENVDRPLLSELDLINCLAFEKTMSEYGRFVLHSSFIETQKGAILFTAPSGTGKSTQADLWYHFRGTEIINGDRSGIWRDGKKWMAGGVPWCGTSGIMKNKTMPLRAIVILRQGPENEIQELRYMSKIRQLLEQTTVNPWNQDMLVRAQMFWIELCKEIPVIQLSCRPDLGAVELLEEELRSKYE